MLRELAVSIDDFREDCVEYNYYIEKLIEFVYDDWDYMEDEYPTPADKRKCIATRIEEVERFLDYEIVCIVDDVEKLVLLAEKEKPDEDSVCV